MFDHQICPICKRNRSEVASHSRGMQVSLGKRTSCVECGPIVMARKDERARFRSLDREDPLATVRHAEIRHAEIRRLNTRISDLKHELCSAQERNKLAHRYSPRRVDLTTIAVIVCTALAYGLASVLQWRFSGGANP